VRDVSPSPPGAKVPALTARIARACNPAVTTAMWVRTGSTASGAMRTRRVVSTGKGGQEISPAQLATVRVLQFLLGLSGRDAAEAVRCCIGFKYARP
jgi:hypothetical protein